MYHVRYTTFAVPKCCIIGYSAYNNNADLSIFLYQTVERRIKSSGVQNVQIIQAELKPAIEGLARAEKEGAKLEYPNGTLLQLISDVDKILYDYYKNSELDLISIFFNVFLSYSTSGGSDMGIVLTPSHITKLFTRIAQVTNKSKILEIKEPMVDLRGRPSVLCCFGTRCCLAGIFCGFIAVG